MKSLFPPKSSRNVLLGLALILMAGMSLTSCLNDDDDYSVEPQWLTMATLVSGGTHPVFIRDEGITLTTVNTLVEDTLVVGRRYLLQYTLADTTNHPDKSYPVYINGYGIPVVKDYLVWAKDSTDLWGDAPLASLTFWFSGHYLNAYLVTYASLGTYNTMELLRNMDDETAKSTDTVPTLNLEIRHNTGSYSTSMGFYRVLSFNLDSLRKEFPLATKFTMNVRYSYLNTSGTLSHKTEALVYEPDRQASVLFGTLRAGNQPLPLNR